eukprot:TRINITY_DN10546_c0_g1_i1.p1 TRINITY_DN10546_c0_g1~~TRINITY_DN10546_c0_g1_i1.p1  ORF type:complete len:1331 (-),score=238.63 TRINITY_DN10546_c0_g1_i1:831-4823(-)
MMQSVVPLVIFLVTHSCVLSQSVPSEVLANCQLAKQNISLSSLDSTDYFLTENRDDKTRIYLGLCHPLKNLPSPAADFCDSSAYSCITKIDASGQEIEYIRNAGSNSSELFLEVQHVALEYKDGSDCINRFNQSVGYTTRIDFFCNYDYSEDNSLRYEGVLGKCTSQIFWHSSLTCLPGQVKSKETGSCVLEIPGYDTKLDLSTWAKDDFYLARSVTGKKRNFQLNICSPVKGLCGNDTTICEIDDTEENLVKNFLEKDAQRILTYDEMKEIITLKYVDSKSQKVEINIECDKSAVEPEITLTSNTDNYYKFRFLTKKACFVPSVQCSAENADGDIFSLEMLKGTEWEVGVAATEKRYSIKVCGSLPMSIDNPCKAQSGVCSYEVEGILQKDPVNFGVMYHSPQVNEDDSISMIYENGDSFTDAKNVTCNKSAEIIFYCSNIEKGPKFDESTDCKHTLIWETPAACPQKKTISHGCTVREPIYGNLFNISELYNSTEDYIVKHDDLTFVLNVCGPILRNCSEGEICIDHEIDLTYDEATLVMRHNSKSKCANNPDVNISADVIFLCEHGVKNGAPTVSATDDDCHFNFEWYTELACPPHEQVQCSIAGPNGVVDLTSLSLPRDNYQIAAENGGEFIINICRSLVHSNKSHCPYQSSACFTKTGVNGQINYHNLGQVRSGLQLDPDDKVYLDYKLGSICTDPKSQKAHMETRIHFECNPDVFDSVPEFVELENCMYVFQWTAAAACPVKQIVEGNCTVTNPASGFTFNLSSLQQSNKNYHWKGTYHHIHGSYQFNVCGPLIGTKCSPGSGMCMGNGTNMGLANANLRIDDGHLSLNYSSGDQCEENQNMHTIIKFTCPPRRNRDFASGNLEKDGPRLVRRNTRCNSVVEFFTELACDHQVHCEVPSGDTVYSLTKLRRHQSNYHVPNKNTNQSDFIINVCGPLVPADVPMSRCNPHGACTQVDGKFEGLGKVHDSPYLRENGHAVIDYVDGGLCGNRGERWTSQIIFSCNSSTSSAEHPFGFPKHISSDNCKNIFHFPTVLACKETYQTQNLSEPDSCQMYHPGFSEYVDISSLRRNVSYHVKNPESKEDSEYFEIQPCGKSAKSCNGAICKVTPFGNYSLGHLNDFTYEPALESVRVRYMEGSECNSQNHKKWGSKIFYTCDENVGTGYPTVQSVYDCLVIFDWRTSAFCRKKGPAIIPPIDDEVPNSKTIAPVDDIVPNSKTISPIDDIVPEAPSSDERDMEEAPPVSGGVSWGHLFLVIGFIFVIAGVVILYRKPEAREKVFRVLQGTRARMPVILGGRRRDDSTLLVSNGRMSASAFGSLTDDDDFS